MNSPVVMNQKLMCDYVNSTDFKIIEIRRFGTSLYSHKSERSGIRYEMAISLREDTIL